jgi:hypothetical protein
VYADRDVTISGGGTKTDTYRDTTYITITQNFNLELKTGWNAVYGKSQFSESKNTVTTNHTISLGNPGSLRWTLHKFDMPEEW